MDIMGAMFIQRFEQKGKRFRISVPINGREILKKTQMIEIHDMITVKQRLLIWQLPDSWKDFHNHKDFYLLSEIRSLKNNNKKH